MALRRLIARLMPTDIARAMATGTPTISDSKTASAQESSPSLMSTDPISPPSTQPMAMAVTSAQRRFGHARTATSRVDPNTGVDEKRDHWLRFPRPHDS
jgi:hypothetical protein